MCTAHHFVKSCQKVQITMSETSSQTTPGGKDEVDRPLVALRFKVANHQRTVGVAARVPRQREGMEDKACGLFLSVFGVLDDGCFLLKK